MISVLYVDDWSPLQSIICRFLERGGDMEVETARSTSDALRILDFISFDIIVTDYNSNESADISLLEQMRQKGRMTPFVFFTLEQNDILEDDAKRYCRVAFVPKIRNSGSSFDELERTIRAMVPAAHPGTTHPQMELFPGTQGGLP